MEYSDGLKCSKRLLTQLGNLLHQRFNSARYQSLAGARQNGIKILRQAIDQLYLGGIECLGQAIQLN